MPNSPHEGAYNSGHIPIFTSHFYHQCFLSSYNLTLKYSFQVFSEELRAYDASSSESGTGDTPMHTADMVFVFSKCID